MILYHGSNIEVQKPRIINTNNGLDFGAGFYLTSDIKQAERWAVLKTRRRKKGAPTLSIFEFNDTNINIGKNVNIKKYDIPDLEWLNFVVANRKGQYNGKLFDIIIGPVANDRTILTINDYISGAIPAETALILLKPSKLTDQYAFLTHTGLQTLKFKEAIKCSINDYKNI